MANTSPPPSPATLLKARLLVAKDNQKRKVTSKSAKAKEKENIMPSQQPKAVVRKKAAAFE
jgi:hypothetical protein